MNGPKLGSDSAIVDSGSADPHGAAPRPPGAPLSVAPWPLDRLIPFARNARTHSDAQVAQIAGSIREFGFVNPVLAAPDGTLIAGHGRVLAARQLGMAEVPVIVLAHLSDTQRRALVLADNKIAMNAGWDEEMLKVELAALSEVEFDLSTVGFAQDELDRLLADEVGVQGLTDEDAAPELQEAAVTRLGELWLMGEHRLLCGDATKREDVERVLGGALADMCFADSPYNVNYGETAKDKLRGNKRKILNDNLGAGFADFLRAASANIVAVTKGAIYMCMSSSELDRKSVV